MVNVRPFFAAAVAGLVLCSVYPASATEEGFGLAGVAFDLPDDLRRVTDKPVPGAMAWEASDGSSRVDAFVRQSDQAALAREQEAFTSWPTYGLGVIEGFGKSQVRELEEALGATCSYRGTPVTRDLGRWLMRVQVDLACATAKPLRLRVSLVLIRTRTAVVTVRVVDRGTKRGVGDLLASMVWTTARVAAKEQLPPKSAAPDPIVEAFAGCRVVAEGPQSWTTDCFNSQVTVMDLDAKIGDDEFVAGIIKGYATAAAKPVERVDTDFVVAGAPVRGVRVFARPNDETSVQFLVLPLVRKEGLRLATCNAYRSGEDLCGELVRAAAVAGWRAGPPLALPRAIRTLTIAGRPYLVPAGCEAIMAAPGFGQVMCSDESILAWGEVPKGQGPEFRDALLQVAHQVGGDGLDVPCSVAGNRAACKVYRDPKGQGAIYAADAELRDSKLFVFCGGTLEARGVPSVCASIFAFGPVDPVEPPRPQDP